MALLELLTYGGEFLLRSDEFVLYEGADSYMCCCPAQCCDCLRIEELRDANAGLGHDLTITATGAISGTGTLVASGLGDYCASWTGEVDTSADDCGGEILNFSADFVCDINNIVKLIFSTGGAACNLTAPNLISFQCGSSGGSPDKMVAVFEAFTNELTSGGCPCGDAQSVIFTVTES